MIKNKSKGGSPMDNLKEVYISDDILYELEQLRNNGDLKVESVCTLIARLSADESGRYILKLH